LHFFDVDVVVDVVVVASLDGRLSKACCD